MFDVNYTYFLPKKLHIITHEQCLVDLLGYREQIKCLF